MLKRDRSSFGDGVGTQEGLKWKYKAKQINWGITAYLMLNQWRHENSERGVLKGNPAIYVLGMHFSGRMNTSELLTQFSKSQLNYSCM